MALAEPLEPRPASQALGGGGYGNIYFALRDCSLDDQFVVLLVDQITRAGATSALDVGCGGLQIMSALLTEMPALTWTGVDISPESARRFGTLSFVAEHTTFIEGSILDNGHLLHEADCIYSYHSLMHLDAAEVNWFFQTISASTQFKVGVFHEPHQTKALTERDGDRLMDYRHNLEGYARRWGLRAATLREDNGSATIVMSRDVPHTPLREITFAPQE